MSVAGLSSSNRMYSWLKNAGLILAVLMLGLCSNVFASPDLSHKLKNGQASLRHKGWYLAKLQNSNYSVLMPARKYQQVYWNSPLKLLDGKRAWVNSAGFSQSKPSYTSYMLTCFTYIGDAPSLNELKAKFSGAKTFLYHGKHAFDVQITREIASKMHFSVFRFVQLSKKQYCMLSAESSLSAEQKNFNTFLGSFDFNYFNLHDSNQGAPSSASWDSFH